MFRRLEFDSVVIRQTKNRSIHPLAFSSNEYRIGLPLKAFYGLFKRTPRYEGTQQQFVLIYDYQDECLRYVLMTSCEDKIRLSEIKINPLQSPTSPVNKYDSVEITFETGHYPRHIAR